MLAQNGNNESTECATERWSDKHDQHLAAATGTVAAHEGSWMVGEEVSCAT